MINVSVLSFSWAAFPCICMVCCRSVRRSAAYRWPLCVMPEKEGRPLFFSMWKFSTSLLRMWCSERVTRGAGLDWTARGRLMVNQECGRSFLASTARFFFSFSCRCIVILPSLFPSERFIRASFRINSSRLTFGVMLDEGYLFFAVWLDVMSLRGQREEVKMLLTYDATVVKLFSEVQSLHGGQKILSNESLT